ncbi:MAG: TrkA family potassium uptake protein [Phycisphaerales bacterium]|nr:TrkA family potassium uptake protein [Phycisphaerales bacterium]
MDRFAVIGLGRFGSRLAQNLAAAGAEVIAIDHSRQIVEELRDKVTLAIALDATDEQALRLQGIDQVDCAVVGIGNNFEANALATVLLRSIGVKRIISRAGNQMQAQILQRIGADGVVRPEDEAADRWSHRLLAPFTIDHIELAESYAIIQMPTPGAWVGKTLAELDMRRKHQVTLVAIKRLAGAEAPRTGAPGLPAGAAIGPSDQDLLERIVEAPLPTSRLRDTDILVIAGFDQDIEKLPK